MGKEIDQSVSSPSSPFLLLSPHPGLCSAKVELSIHVQKMEVNLFLPLREDLDRSVHLSTLFLVRCSPLSGWAYSFPRNWQVPFLNQQKGENDHQKYFIITLHERKLPDPVWIKPVTSWSPARPASGCATEPSTYRTKGYNKILSTFKDYLIIILR